MLCGWWASARAPFCDWNRVASAEWHVNEASLADIGSVHKCTIPISWNIYIKDGYICTLSWNFVKLAAKVHGQIDGCGCSAQKWLGAEKRRTLCISNLLIKWRAAFWRRWTQILESIAANWFQAVGAPTRTVGSSWRKRLRNCERSAVERQEMLFPQANRMRSRPFI